MSTEQSMQFTWNLNGFFMLSSGRTWANIAHMGMYSIDLPATVHTNVGYMSCFCWLFFIRNCLQVFSNVLLVTERWYSEYISLKSYCLIQDSPAQSWSANYIFKFAPKQCCLCFYLGKDYDFTCVYLSKRHDALIFDDKALLVVALHSFHTRGDCCN